MLFEDAVIAKDNREFVYYIHGMAHPRIMCGKIEHISSMSRFNVSYVKRILINQLESKKPKLNFNRYNKLRWIVEDRIDQPNKYIHFAFMRSKKLRHVHRYIPLYFMNRDREELVPICNAFITYSKYVNDDSNDILDRARYEILLK